MRASVATRMRSSCCLVLSFRVFGNEKELMEGLRSCCAIVKGLKLKNNGVIRVSWRIWNWN